MRIFLIVAAVTSLVACSDSSSPSLEQQPASSTAFMGVVVSGGRTKIYLQSASNPDTGETKLAVVDAAAPAGTSGLITFIDLGAGAVPRAVGADGTDLVVLDRNDPKVHFVDGATDTVRGSATFPPEAEPIPSSNPGYYSAAVAVDTAQRRAFVATSLGVLQYDYDLAGQVFTHADTFSTPPTESFALDRAADRIYAPFYLCAPDPDPTICVPYTQPGGPALTDSVTVIDVPSRLSFALVDPAAPLPAAPLGYQPDATALDTQLGVLAIATEDPSNIWVMDLAATTYDTTALTCGMQGHAVAMPDAEYTMVAADVGTHLLVVGQEDAAGIAFVDLAEAKAGRTKALMTQMPNLPNGDPWFSKGDPHSVAIGVVGGRSYAFVAEASLVWLARIDLAGVREVMDGVGTFESKVSFITIPVPP